MTLTKQSLSEALTFHQTISQESVRAAARFVERLLPEKCEPCGGSGEDGFDRQGSHAEDRYVGYVHEACHGSGQLWDEGLVEVVAATMCRIDNQTGPDVAVEGIPCDVHRDVARAVLAALAEEVGK